MSCCYCVLTNATHASYASACRAAHRLTESLIAEDKAVTSARVFDFDGDPVAGSVKLSSLVTQGSYGCGTCSPCSRMVWLE